MSAAENLYSTPLPTIVGFTPNTSKRIVDAASDQIPLEELVMNLRKVFIGNHEKVTEARFEEVVDIIADQKDDTDGQLGSMLTSVNQVKDQQNDFDMALGAMNDRLGKMQENWAAEMKGMLQYCDDMVQKLRQEMEARNDANFERLEKTFTEFADQSRGGLNAVSDALAEHIAEDEKKFDQLASASLTQLEQRIAQWRAELEDERREDMGQRLMSLGRP